MVSKSSFYPNQDNLTGQGLSLLLDGHEFESL